jgi:hypothetical protein
MGIEDHRRPNRAIGDTILEVTREGRIINPRDQPEATVTGNKGPVELSGSVSRRMRPC